MASSLALTPEPNVGKLNSLPFSDIFVGVICWRRSKFWSSALLVAVTSPLTFPPERLVPRYVKTGIFFPPQSFKSIGQGPEGPEKSLSLAAYWRLRTAGAAAAWRRNTTVNHVLQFIRIR